MKATDQKTITLTIAIRGSAGVAGIVASSIAMQCSVCEESFPCQIEFIGAESDVKLVAQRSLEARRRYALERGGADELDYREIGGMNEKA